MDRANFDAIPVAQAEEQAEQRLNAAIMDPIKGSKC